MAIRVATSRAAQGRVNKYHSVREASLTFTPTELSGLKVWLDASALTGFNDGDAVTTWTDLSGNSFSPTQGSSGSRPLYKTNIIGGQPVLRFDGTDDYLNYAGAILPTGAPAVTVFIVAKLASMASFPELVQIADTQLSGLNGFQFITHSDGGMYSANVGSNNERYTASSTLVINTAYQLTYEVAASTAWSSTNPKHYKNGALQSNTRGTGTGTPALNGSTNKFRVGANVDSPIAQYVNGDIAEILLYNNVFTTTDRQKVENYLVRKYSL